MGEHQGPLRFLQVQGRGAPALGVGAGGAGWKTRAPYLEWLKGRMCRGQHTEDCGNPDSCGSLQWEYQLCGLAL